MTNPIATIATIAIKWNIEDANEAELEINEQTEIRVSDAIDAFAGEEFTDDELEGLIKDAVDEDFREKIGAVIDADALTAAVAALRQALEKARTT
jgi:hypothetical protein